MMKKIRRIIQIVWTVIANGYIVGFLKGQIYIGGTKHICVPMLNCYSCPGALGACPIGSMQAVLGHHKHSFTFYVLGSLMLFGVLLGRVVCGFLCPFGLIQDLLYKIKLPKLKIAKKIDKPLRYLKYVILVLFVIIFPLFLTNKYGNGSPAFCKYICPVGTLEGGIPLVVSNPTLQAMVGWLFSWKVMLLSAVLILSMFVYRPFCKYLCPLGAFYGLFAKISFFQMTVSDKKCIDCKACEKACKMNVEITKEINTAECIRCGDCIDVCPTNAITFQNGMAVVNKKLQEK